MSNEYVHTVVNTVDEDTSSTEEASVQQFSSRAESIFTTDHLKDKGSSYHFWEQSVITATSLFDLEQSAEVSLKSLAESFPPDIFSHEIDESECYTIEEPTPTASDEYDKNCAKYHLATVESVKLALQNEDSINLARYRVHNLNLHFICKAIIGPPLSNVTHLDISFNPFEDEACITLSDLMQQSFSLLYLNLSNCKIGPTGVEILADGIELSQSITHLNLSRCNIRDTGGVIVIAAVAVNEVLKVLNLSQNHLHVNTAAELNKMLAVNTTLEALSLEWNDLYPQKEASVPIMNGLKKNVSLKFLDLSWNGIAGNLFSKALMRVMRNNAFILRIWLNNNYLTSKEIGDICIGIKRSKSIRELQLAGNIFTMEDYGKLLNAVEFSPTVRNVNLGKYTYLSENLYNQAVELNKIIKEKYPGDIGIIFKGQTLPNPPDTVDFLAIIFDRAKFLAMKPKKKKLRRDIGHLMINIREGKEEFVKEENFRDAVKKFKARLDDDLVDHFVEEFTERVKVGKRTRKRVAIQKMAAAYLKRHPTEPPPPAKPKRKKKKKNKG